MSVTQLVYKHILKMPVFEAEKKAQMKNVGYAVVKQKV